MFLRLRHSRSHLRFSLGCGRVFGWGSVKTRSNASVEGANVGTQHEKASVRQLSAVEKMASAVYRGSYDDFKAVMELHISIGKWIEANGYTVAGASREIYLQPPQKLGEGLVGVMELQYPIQKA